MQYTYIVGMNDLYLLPSVYLFYIYIEHLNALGYYLAGVHLTVRK